MCVRFINVVHYIQLSLGYYWRIFKVRDFDPDFDKIYMGSPRNYNLLFQENKNRKHVRVEYIGNLFLFEVGEK